MSLRITHVRMRLGGSRHEHIEAVNTVNEATGQVALFTVALMVDHIDNRHGRAFVSDGRRGAEVVTVHPRVGKPFLHAGRNGVLTDDLLRLPPF